MKLTIEKLKESAKNLYRKHSLLSAWKSYKYPVKSGENPPLEIPDEWLIREKVGVFKIPINLFDAFNFDFADADWKGGVKAYRKDHYSTLLSYLYRFSNLDTFHGSLDLTQDGKLGGKLEVSGGDATHRWAALVWNSMYEGYPVPDVPVELTLVKLNKEIVEYIIKNFYVLYGSDPAVSLVNAFLKSKDIRVESPSTLNNKNSRRISLLLSERYCLVDRTACPRELIGVILADLSGFIREVSFELKSILEHQEKAIESWEMTKKQLKSQKDWQQEVYLITSSEETGRNLSIRLGKKFRSSVPYTVESNLPCDAVLYFKGFPLAVFLREPKESCLEKAKRFFPKAKFFKVKIHDSEHLKWIDIEEV